MVDAVCRVGWLLDCVVWSLCEGCGCECACGCDGVWCDGIVCVWLVVSSVFFITASEQRAQRRSGLGWAGPRAIADDIGVREDA